MKINGEDISNEKKAEIQAELLKIDEDTMADWLWRALMSVYKSSESETPKVITLDYFGTLDIEDTVDLTLACVYREFILEPKQILFRQTLGDLLRRYCNDPGAPMQAFLDLVFLIGFTKATESLDALYPALGNGGIGKWHPEIIYLAIGVLAPALGNCKKLAELMEYQNFKEKIYLTEVIKIFAKYDQPLAMEIVEKYIATFQHRYEKDLKRARLMLSNRWAKSSHKLIQAFSVGVNST